MILDIKTASRKLSLDWMINQQMNLLAHPSSIYQIKSS
ncbi:hypothetical protein Q7O_002634 [Pectobacterium carotovorum subsp. carotovorum PCCS1]|nr:hypothetical protein [Pectobacterium carotovorum subsp. carotovorum PCCS1]